MKANGAIGVLVAAMLIGSEAIAVESPTAPSRETGSANKTSSPQPELHIPDVVADRIVDAIMDWGDHTLGGPFKKGGGDEDATRSLLKDIVTKASPGSVVWDMTVGSEPHTATPKEDAPGYTPSGQTRVMPPGALLGKAPDADRTNPTDPEFPPLPIALPAEQIPAQVPVHNQKPDAQGPGPSERSVPEPVHITAAGGLRVTTSGENATGAPSPPADRPGQQVIQAGGPTFEQVKDTPDVHLNPEAPRAAPAPAPAAPPAQPTPAPAPPAHTFGPDHNPADHLIDHSKPEIIHAGPDHPDASGKT